VGPHIRFGGNGYALSRDLKPRLVPVAGLKPLGRATRKHPPAQIRKLAASLDRFGFVLPIVTQGDRVVGGWALVVAAKQMGLTQVPAVSLTNLSEAELRALRLALNRLGEDADWDRKALAIELSEVLQLEPDIDLEICGFEIGEIATLLDDGGSQDEEFLPVDVAATPVTQSGDLWVLGDHRVFCGDALSPESYGRVLGSEKAEMMFTDPHYHVAIGGEISGLGAIKRGGFAGAPGELSSAKFLAFLKTFFAHAASYSVDGAIHFVCVDWQHMKETIIAGEEIYGEPMDLCVWTKAKADPGLLYHAQHELIFVFKIGSGAHINNVAVGRNGRHRTNVWDYVSENALNSGTKGKVTPRSMITPVGMIADAMRDCSNRGGVVLDPFGAAGSALIAAERTGRRARVIELDPSFVDISIERWQRLTGGRARHGENGRPFVRPGNTGVLSGTTVSNSRE
jgi:DNA modification methylase